MPEELPLPVTERTRHRRLREQGSTDPHGTGGHRKGTSIGHTTMQLLLFPQLFIPHGKVMRTFCYQNNYGNQGYSEINNDIYALHYEIAAKMDFFRFCSRRGQLFRFHKCNRNTSS